MSDNIETSEDDESTPWVKIKISLAGSRKVFRLKNVLDLNSRNESLGIIVNLYIQTWIHAWKDGDWSKWEPADLEEKLGWRGEGGGMIKGLQESGLLDGMRVHNWHKRQRGQINRRIRKNGWNEVRGNVIRRPGPQEEDPNYLANRTKAVLAAKEKRG